MLDGPRLTDRRTAVAVTGSSVGGDVIVQVTEIHQVVERWRARHVPRALDRQHEERIAGLFVNPPGWDRATAILREQRVVLVQAAPGTGRRTAALRLLHIDNGGSEPIHELPVPGEENAEEHVLDPDDVADADRLLLDLAPVGDERVQALYGRLRAFCTAVRARQATLVVVLSGRTLRITDPGLVGLLARLGRPDGVAVLRRHLDAYRIGHADHDLRQDDLVPVLERGSMRDIEHLASLVREARDRCAAGTSVATLLDQACAALADQADEVAAQVAGRPGRARTLMLASALFEGAAVDAVFEAESLLVQTVRYPDLQTHELEEPDLRSRLDDIDVEVGPDRRVRFRRPNHAEAVCRHFWRYFPRLRDQFRNWVVQCGHALSAVDGDDVVERYLDACLQVGRSRDVLVAIEAWASREPLRLAAALTALERGLAAPREGWRFRRRCYEWSINRRLAVPLAHIVIAACVDVIAPNHPQQAIVRLHHLTRHDEDDVAMSARHALLRLADDRRLLRRTLARLVTPELSNLHEPRGRSLFLALADPERLLKRSSSGRPLLGEPGVRNALVSGWAAVLLYPSRAEYEGRVRHWFDVATEQRVDDLLAVLVDACRADFAVSATLVGAAYRWLEETADERAPSDRRQTVRTILRAVDGAIGMDARDDMRLDEGRS